MKQLHAPGMVFHSHLVCQDIAHAWYGYTILSSGSRTLIGELGGCELPRSYYDPGFGKHLVRVQVPSRGSNLDSSSPPPPHTPIMNVASLG